MQTGTKELAAHESIIQTLIALKEEAKENRINKAEAVEAIEAILKTLSTLRDDVRDHDGPPSAS